MKATRSAPQDRDAVAAAFDFGQGVRNQNCRMARRLALDQHIVEQSLGVQVHPLGRLVEDQQDRIVDQRLGQGQALEHPFAEPADRLARPGRPGRPAPAAWRRGCEPPPPAPGPGPRSIRAAGWPKGNAERPGSRGRSRREPASRGPRPARPSGVRGREVARHIDSRILTSVVLPARFGPTMPNTSPAATDSVTPESALNVASRPAGRLVDLDDVLEFGHQWHGSIRFLARVRNSWGRAQAGWPAGGAGHWTSETCTPVCKILVNACCRSLTTCD